MSMKEEQPASGSSNTFEQTFDAYTAQHPDRWYLGATIPTLDQVRGKIVLLRRFSATSTPKGIDATVWADNTTFTIDNGSAKVRIQDYYEISDDDSKWTTITNLLTEAKAGSPTVLFLNHTSAYQVADGGLENIPERLERHQSQGDELLHRQHVGPLRRHCHGLRGRDEERAHSQDELQVRRRSAPSSQRRRDVVARMSYLV